MSKVLLFDVFVNGQMYLTFEHLLTQESVNRCSLAYSTPPFWILEYITIGPFAGLLSANFWISNFLNKDLWPFVF